jgi:quercetin dioxygenase-like cupin family protein
MNLLTALLTTIALLAPTPVEVQTMVITRAGSRSVQPGPTDHFTGSVRVERLFDAVDPSHASGGAVTFEPGARTAWHSHPRGQILIVTAGIGRVQRWGDRIEEIRSGDVVRIPAGQKHWHGASPHTSMTHIAIAEYRDGTIVEWMEKVTDEQYNAAWLRLGMRIERIQPGHPQQNGRHERMHLTLKREATKPAAANVLQQQARFDASVERYNRERPHQAAGADVSVSRSDNHGDRLRADVPQRPEGKSQPGVCRAERGSDAGRRAHLARHLHALRYGPFRR